MRETLVIATGNKGKLREYQQLLSELPLNIVSLEDVGISLEVEETGNTFSDNAWLKALTYSNLTGMLTLSDDSGLEVDALHAQPGVHSARYGGEYLTSDEERVSLLLKNLESVRWTERTARFKCVIAIAGSKNHQINPTEYPNQESKSGRIASVVGSISGMIQYEPRGEDGFGYDPVFFLPSIKQTMAEMTLEYKNLISHRSDATRKVIQVLRTLAGH
ncbi:MAG: non-canonical purine NTP pyrophosphatase, RdgB/HAM1 family [Chloroflexi bacterium]|nr:non-canonical purine NTP pyrophosphatase, RdgB/HAM1 family [Chloroflexota bacterium]